MPAHETASFLALNCPYVQQRCPGLLHGSYAGPTDTLKLLSPGLCALPLPSFTVATICSASCQAKPWRVTCKPLDIVVCLLV